MMGRAFPPALREGYLFVTTPPSSLAEDKMRRGNTTANLSRDGAIATRVDHLIDSTSFRGYGWPAILDILSPPVGKPVDSRRTIRMGICPACSSVHETGGGCFPSHSTATASDDNVLELYACGFYGGNQAIVSPAAPVRKS